MHRPWDLRQARQKACACPFPWLTLSHIFWPMVHPLPTNVDDAAALLARGDYVAPRDLAVLIFLCLTLNRPLFVEGEPGTGKTEIAKVLSATLNRRLIRLQCYEGLDTQAAIYEWNHARQMLAIRMAEHREQAALNIYGREFLLERPLLQALAPDDRGPPVLLIDELDRADEPFEAMLLEVLSDFQVSIPEFGVITAEQPPIVIITSNRTREVHDAVKRRCLYHWVDYPDAERERAILSRKVPGLSERLSAQITAFVQSVRRLDLYKAPGVAETLDWARALTALNATMITPAVTADTLGALLKYQEDVEKVRNGGLETLVSAANSATVEGHR